MMRLFSVFALALGLAMDATAVAATKGFANPRARLSQTMRLALLFGGFQAGMPLLGYLVGARFAKAIEAWDHWIAFVLLGGIGLKMLYEVWKGDDEKDDAEKAKEQSFAWGTLLLLAVATSIDALVAGLTLPMMNVPILVAITIIGLVTAALSTAGVYLGRRLGEKVGRKLDVFGGLVLIALGTKILIEHLSAG